MAWKETNIMEERIRFVMLAEEKRMAFSVLCSFFNVSRETGYKWLERFRSEGIQGLNDKSRRPLHNPRELGQKTVESILEIRQRHPTWGPKKIAVLLEEKEQHEIIPSASTIGEVLKRNDLVRRRRKRSKPAVQNKPILEMIRPNDVWCADFKGHFLLRDGQRCHPLTITDGFSRYLLCCEAMLAGSILDTQKAFEQVFNSYGLPKFILSDNGKPFAAPTATGLTRLSVWWIKLGIRPVRIQPGHPEQNGRHERMHRTLKAETARPSQQTMVQQQDAFVRFREEYNQLRPHEALGQKRPAELYQRSLDNYFDPAFEVKYAPRFETRRVGSKGEFSWKNKDIFISETLAGETVGFEETGDRLWTVYFHHIPVSIFDEQTKKMTALPPRQHKPKLSGMSSV